jgi:hypothetical protein
MRGRWYQPPPEVLVEPVDSPALRQVQEREGASFMAFLGAQQQVAAATGGEQR